MSPSGLHWFLLALKKAGHASLCNSLLCHAQGHPSTLGPSDNLSFLLPRNVTSQLLASVVDSIVKGSDVSINSIRVSTRELHLHEGSYTSSPQLCCPCACPECAAYGQACHLEPQGFRLSK